MQRVERDAGAAQVSDVFAERQLAVDFEARQCFVRAVLIDDLLRARLKLFCVFVSPPFVQVAVGVVLSPLVVVAVRDFVADDHADRAVVDRIVHLRVEEGRLQDARWEDNFIQRRVEVSVDRLRRHVPLGAINRLANTRELAARLKLRGALGVAPVVVAPDPDRRVIAELVRVANLLREAVELRERFGARGIGHPIEFLEAIAKNRFQVRDQFAHARAGGWRKIFFDVKPAERLADGTVNDVRGALPARFGLRRAAQNGLIESKILVLGRAVQKRRGAAQQVPAQINLPVRQRAFFDQLLLGLQKFRLPDDEMTGFVEPARAEIRFPRQRRGELLQFRDRKFMVVGDGIAQVRTRFAGLREGCFQVENRGRMSSGLTRGLSKHSQHGRDVRVVRLALFGERVFEVVIAVRQAEAALRDAKGVNRTVFRIGFDPRVEKRADAALVKIREQPENVVPGTKPRDAFKIDGNRPESELFKPVRIHGRREEVADLACRAFARRIAVGGARFEDGADQSPVALLQFIETAPARFVRRHRIVF